MISADYEFENNISYVILEAIMQEPGREYELKMLERNAISGILPFKTKCINDKRMFYYNISGMKQLSSIFETRRIDYDFLRMMLSGISLLVNSINEYMLNIDSVILSPEFIYVDLSSGKVSFIYYPGSCDMFNMNKLFDYILQYFDHSIEKEKLIKIYDIYQKVHQGNYNLANMEELVDIDLIRNEDNKSFANGKENTNDDEVVLDSVVPEIITEEKEDSDNRLTSVFIKVKYIGIFLVIAGICGLIFNNIMPEWIRGGGAIVFVAVGVVFYAGSHALQKLQSGHMKYVDKLQQYVYVNSKADDKSSDNYLAGKDVEGITGEINESENNPVDTYDNNTVLLSDYLRQMKEAHKKELRLIFQNSEDGVSTEAEDNITVNKSPFMIGSMGKHCDFVLNNSLISRMHMCILYVENEYFMEDLNSTNGVFLNGERLPPNSRLKINDGDIIKLATLVYKVEIG